MLGCRLRALRYLLARTVLARWGEGAIKTLRRGYRWPVGLAAVGGLAAGIFALDLVTPRGVVGGTLYAVLVLASAWLPWPKAPLGTAMIATVLNVAGYMASGDGIAPAWFALTNRTAAFAVIWITALLLYRRLELERALAASQARYQSLLTERALEESRDRYRQLIEASPDAILVHQDGVIRFVNPGALALLGTHDTTVLIGRSVREFLPEANRTAAGAQTGRLADAERSTPWTEQRLVRLDGHEVAVEVGEVRITVEGQAAAQTIVRDISERKRAERERELLSRELSHRVKNTLAVVQALAMQTDHSSSVKEYREKFVGRLSALARAHSLLLDSHWRGADLKQLVEQALQVYEVDRPDVLEIQGDPVPLSPTKGLGLSLILHELATNAAKYGALARSEGRVRVSWDVEQGRWPARPPALGGAWSTRTRAAGEERFRHAADRAGMQA